MVRELVGLGAGDEAARVNDALAALIARAEPAESERAWLRSRLSVLADVGRADDGEGPMPLGEAAAAAARVLSAVADERPIVIAIEDLHWSEVVLRDVLSTIVDDADAPIVVLCTARPELFDVDPGWGGGRANSTTIRLLPLNDEESTALVETLLSSAMLTEAIHEYAPVGHTVALWATVRTAARRSSRWIGRLRYWRSWPVRARPLRP